MKVGGVSSHSSSDEGGGVSSHSSSDEGGRGQQP